MSLVFSVEAARAPRIRDVTGRVALRDLQCVESLADWPGEALHFYREGVSGQTIELSYHCPVVRVRVRSMPTADDVDLAVQLAGTIAELDDEDVRIDDAVPVSLDELRQTCTTAWIADHVRLGAAALLESVERDQTESTVPGVLRSLVVGPRSAARLRREPDPESALIEALRRLQWVDTRRYRESSPMEAQSPSGDVARFQLWDPSAPALLGSGELLALWPGEQAGALFFSLFALEEVAASLTWLGERHALIEALPSGELSRIVERARRHEVFPFGRIEPSARR